MDFLKPKNSPQDVTMKNSPEIAIQEKNFQKKYATWNTWKVPSGAKYELVRGEVQIVHKFRPNGTKLSFQRFRQKSGKPVGVVFNHHGYTGSQNGCCYHTDLLAQQGYDIIGFDQEGHGRTGGNPSFTHKETIVTNACEFVLKILSMDKSLQGLPTFLWGISLGGMTALGMSLQHESFVSKIRNQLKGMVLLCPAIEPVKNTGMPNFWGMKDVIEKFAEEDVLPNLQKVSIPFLIMHGTSDSLIHFSGAVKLFERAKDVKDRTLVRFVGAGHNLQYTEWSGRKATLCAVNWIIERT